MPITKIYKGNIRDATTQCKVNTVNVVGAMGAGIAVYFRYQYPEMFEKYKKYCKDGIFKVGMLQIYKKTKYDWVINFPTKRHWKDPSKIEYIEMGLQKFVETYKEKGIRSVTFPQMGCGNGGLDWEKEVLPLMEKYLNSVDIPIEIVLY